MQKIDVKASVLRAYHVINENVFPFNICYNFCAWHFWNWHIFASPSVKSIILLHISLCLKNCTNGKKVEEVILQNWDMGKL